MVAMVTMLGACERKAPKDPPAPAPGSAIAVPDVTTIDWRNRSYELASLGTVKATDGRAEFKIVEDENGMHADQSPAAKGADGALTLAPAHYADLDGDRHDEALIPFEMRTTHADDAEHVFGVFAFTQYNGDVIRLGVVTSPTVLEIDGATIVAANPPRRWRWKSGAFVAE
jgi:hypothetical protein